MLFESSCDVPRKFLNCLDRQGVECAPARDPQAVATGSTRSATRSAAAPGFSGMPRSANDLLAETAVEIAKRPTYLAEQEFWSGGSW